MGKQRALRASWGHDASSWPKVVVLERRFGPVHEWRARIDFAITNELPRYGGEDHNGAELDTQGLT